MYPLSTDVYLWGGATPVAARVPSFLRVLGKTLILKLMGASLFCVKGRKETQLGFDFKD